MTSESGDIEQMIRAAGGYLEVSDDLRPRVIENARSNQRESIVLWKVTGLAVFVAAVALFASGFTIEQQSPPSMTVTVTSDQLHVIAQQKMEASVVDVEWSLADSFKELRQRQARFLERVF